MRGSKGNDSMFIAVPHRAFSAAALVAALSAGCADDLSGHPDLTSAEIIGGTVDADNVYASVGALVGLRADGTTRPFCTGTLIAPTVLLTAAHCVTDPVLETVAVTFDPAYTADSALL